MLKIDGLVSGYGSVQILNGANMKVDAQSIVALLGVEMAQVNLQF